MSWIKEIMNDLWFILMVIPIIILTVFVYLFLNDDPKEID